MISRRRVIYYTILTTSLFWIFGTVAFFFLQSLEVNIEVKRRRQVEYLSKPNWNIRLNDEKLLPPPLPSPKKLSIDIIKDDKKIKKVVQKEEKSSPKPRKVIYSVAEYEKYPTGIKLDGPGDEGEGVTVNPKFKKKEDEGYELHSFNLVASDMMSLHRRLPDYRHDA